MSNITTSYQFHKELESPVAFVRREWKALAIFGGGFVLILATVVLAIDPAFFYPRLSTDPLLYYLKGLAFAETGHTAARTAINREPFDYVGLPGVLRAPFIMAFSDFDSQLRAIQLSNVLLLAVTATMYAYILSWVVPRKWQWLAIGSAFGFMLLAPDWVANVFEPLADAPYAAFSVAFLILATRVICSDRPLHSRPWALLAGAVLFTLTFLVRFTAPFMLIHVAVLAAGGKLQGKLTRKTIAGAGGVVAVGVAILTAMSWHTLRVRYLIVPFIFIIRGSRLSILGHLLLSALPAQIIPVFNLGFPRPPMIDAYHVRFGTSPPELALVALGLVVSATIVFGMWRSRNRFAPEFAYCVVGLALLGPIIPSATRYLMAYQPFLWIFFYAGVAPLFAPVAGRLASRPRAVVAGLALLLLTAASLVYVRAQRIGGTESPRNQAISIGATERYVHDVSSTFRSLRNFLETLPRDRTLLVAAPGLHGRWKVISGLDYYRPDSALSVAVAERETYLLVECGTLETCQDFAGWDALLHKGLEKFGDYSYEQVFFKANPHGKAMVYRIRNRQ